MGDSSNLSLDEPWTKPSRFKEHLSFASNHNSAHEVSRFSPDTPSHLRAEQDDVPPPLLEETRSWPLPPHNHNSMISFGSSTFKAFSPPPKMRDLEQGPDFHDVELDRSDTHRTRTTFRDRMSRRLLEFGLGKRPTTAQLDLPIQDLPSWPPLNIHKHTLSQGQCCAHCKKRQEKESAGRKWRTRILIMITIILLLWLLGNTIALNIATFRPPSSTTIPDVSDGLNFDRKVCLSQFRVNAPSNPKLYPCAQCLSLLEQIPSNATSSYGTAANAAQFCSVRSLWEDADAAGQAALEESGWVRDVKFCSWGGIQCNGAGQISSIQLTAPAIPAGIPSQLSSSGLPGLETFQIVGNTTTPTGSLPPSFASFNLTTLHLESTGLQGDIPGTLQSLSTLALVRNPNLSSSLPDTVTQGNLKSLIVTNENLTLSQTQQAAFCSLGRLSTCDLRESGIASCGSCHVA